MILIYHSEAPELVAYHNDPEIKTSILAQLQLHHDAEGGGGVR